MEKYLQRIQSYPLLSIKEEIECARAVRKGAEAEKTLKEKKKEIKRLKRKIRREPSPEAEKEFLLAEKKFKKIEKELQLLIKARAAAITKLAEGNYRFVISVVKQFKSRGVTQSDLVNVGNLGLLRAINRFDETRGFKLISYAVWWIRQAVMQFIQEKSRTVRRPLNCVALEQKIIKTDRGLQHVYNRKIIPDEISERTGIPVETVEATVNARKKAISIDMPFKEGQDGSLSDILKSQDSARPDDVLVRNSIKEELYMMISKLGSREQEVIKSYYGIGKKDNFSETLEDIGDKISLTRERVRQIKEKALKELKAFFKKQREKNEASQATETDFIGRKKKLEAPQEEIAPPRKKRKVKGSAVATDSTRRKKKPEAPQEEIAPPRKKRKVKASSVAADSTRRKRKPEAPQEEIAPPRKKRKVEASSVAADATRRAGKSEAPQEEIASPRKKKKAKASPIEPGLRGSRSAAEVVQGKGVVV